MIYDPVRNRLLSFGGSDGAYHNDVWENRRDGTGWHAVPTTGTPPPPRRLHRAIYDSGADRIIVFGGYDDALMNDVWQLSLSDPPTWTPILAAGTAPSPRGGAGAVYDAANQRLVVFGGFDGVSPNLRTNDVWALSLTGPPAWTQLVPSGVPPSPRSSHTAVYVPGTGSMLVFGGTDPNYLNDSWSLSLGGSPSWTSIATAGGPPAPREEHCAVFDAVAGRLVVFGGYDASYYYGDTWGLAFGSGTPTWSVLTPFGTPYYRWGAGAALTPANEMIVYGGYSYGYLGDSWLLPLSGPLVWQSIDESEHPRRLTASLVGDPSRTRMVLFGGSDGAYQNDVWVRSLVAPGAWSALGVAGAAPGARRLHSAIYDPIGDRMIVFGGYDDSTLGDLWQLTFSGTPTWSPLGAGGPGPSPRAGHAAIYDPTQHRMIVCGGYDGVTPPNNRVGDVWELSLTGSPQWTPIAAGAGPSPRSSATAVFDPTGPSMILFGGSTPVFQNEAWRLNLAGPPAWTMLSPTGGPPAPREEHSAVYDEGNLRMVVFGGTDGSYYYNDVWEFQVGDTPAWAQLVPASPQGWPWYRWGHRAIYDPPRGRMVFHGGYVGEYSNETWFLQWTSQPTSALVSLAEASADRGVARLAWIVSDPSVDFATVHREDGSGHWTSLGPAVGDGTGRFAVEDRNVEAGRAYGYQLEFAVDGQVVRSATTWVSVPADVRFGIRAVSNATPGGSPAVLCSLPRGGDARIEVIDVAGRLELALERRSLPAGEHRVMLDAGSLRQGVHLVRLRVGDASAQAKVVVTR